jgi:hypothetical protein
MNLRDREVAAVTRMLSPGGGAGVGKGESDDFSDQWKVLIYDQDCRDIISPIMNIGALRQRGVTLHLLVRNCCQRLVLLFVDAYWSLVRWH